MTQSKQQTGSQMKKKKKGNIRSLWDKIKWASLCIIGISDGNEREKGIKNGFEEIMTENFANLKKETPGTGSTEDPKLTYTKTCYN